MQQASSHLLSQGGANAPLASPRGHFLAKGGGGGTSKKSSNTFFAYKICLSSTRNGIYFDYCIDIKICLSPSVNMIISQYLLYNSLK